MNNYVIKKCLKCGAVVRVLNDCNCDDCGITCCNQKMIELKANSSDGSVEKHLPVYEIEDNKINIIVNHVMDEDHYIKWISMVYANKEIITYLKPGDTANISYEYVKGATIYAYCNKHGLWQKEVE